jgi:hypothetical protein
MNFMFFTPAIERNREALIRIVAALYAMIGLTEAGGIERLKWPMYRAVLALLRPAESAVRRLIVMAAQGLAVKPMAAGSASRKRATAGKRKTRRHRIFSLFDPRQRERLFVHRGGRPSFKVPRAEPRIRSFNENVHVIVYRNGAPPAPPPPLPQPADSVNAGALCRRLAAIREALQDLPGQARRYARWRAMAMADHRPQRAIFRRGPPPGLRPKSRHEVHAILKECDWLAREALTPNTS